MEDEHLAVFTTMFKGHPAHPTFHVAQALLLMKTSCMTRALSGIMAVGKVQIERGLVVKLEANIGVNNVEASVLLVILGHLPQGLPVSFAFTVTARILSDHVKGKSTLHRPSREKLHVSLKLAKLRIVLIRDPGICFLNQS